MRNASEKQDLSRQVESLSAQVADQNRVGDFVTGSSAVMRHVMDLVRKVAKLDTTVLVQGESGTGKEMVARRLHDESPNADGPFIPVNLAAVPSELVESTLFGHEKGAFTGAVRQQLGKFEMAAGGTLFLDEIGELRLDLQAKLLRAIQEGEIERVGGTKPIRTDFRLVAATHVDLERAIREGRFREDLYYRIRVIPIQMPPLRERLEDLPALIDFFVHRYNARFHKNVMGVSDEALGVLRSYWWPGNVRELAEPGRAAGRDRRARLHRRGGPAARAAAGPPQGQVAEQRRPVRRRGRRLRAQPDRPRAPGVRRQRLGGEPLSRRPAHHAQAQDPAPRHPRAGADRPWRRPARPRVD